MMESRIPEFNPQLIQSQRSSVEAVKQAHDQIINLMKQKEMKFMEAESFKKDLNPAEDMMRVFQNTADKESVYVEYKQKLGPYFEFIKKRDEEIEQKSNIIL